MTDIAPAEYNFYRAITHYLGVTVEGDNYSQTDWTRDVHKHLAIECMHRFPGDNLKAWSKAFLHSESDKRLQHGEYLVDLCVAQEPPGYQPALYWNHYRGLLLAAETEWSPKPHSIWEDIIKLTDVNSKLRIYVGGLSKGKNASYSSEASRIRSELEHFCRQHEHFEESEHFLVFFWNYDDNDDYQAWIIDGLGRSIQLER